ncbi:hypothetical protein I7I48_03699 [Histoplasma ohiense]|nr:hypothetical protein I7I48_03699 [Histoplasma ohiense (nom. inval.)]
MKLQIKSSYSLYSFILLSFTLSASVRLRFVVVVSMFERFFDSSGGGGGDILNGQSHHGGSYRRFFDGWFFRGFFSRWRSSDSDLYSQFHLILLLFDILLISS